MSCFKSSATTEDWVGIPGGTSIEEDEEITTVAAGVDYNELRAVSWPGVKMNQEKGGPFLFLKTKQVLAG